ncbi:Larval cuticle protein LCP-17 [Amphibalanus amphitrite]|uniref:Larval cuticle protein LCP-17 n=1 Tax=Amphibalanus amphitrite TaxID=1232801 RepID=A0A6A4W2F9_AMPAM|nr:endocuticle structural glycoprotein SgAbd-1-like [Amphibalanus amphitrite]KAF0301446.1 Larval cuticle protein LCP-17 [Amphibalanus amphitrite]KAF0301557.1 Larval cuticle protein LCP-17 [Amphibalanus amphitrite]
MKLLLVFALVAVAAAEKLDNLEKEPIAILRMDSTSNEDGSFQYQYETANKIQADVQGQLKQIGEEFGTVMQGSYSYETPEGQTVTITWTADENGYRAEGDAIPKAPTV